MMQSLPGFSQMALNTLHKQLKTKAYFIFIFIWVEDSPHPTMEALYFDLLLHESCSITQKGTVVKCCNYRVIFCYQGMSICMILSNRFEYAPGI